MRQLARTLDILASDFAFICGKMLNNTDLLAASASRNPDNFSAAKTLFESGFDRTRFEQMLVASLRMFREAADDPPSRRFIEFILKNCHRSYAQLFQDLFVAYALAEKREGVFVEIGVGDGKAMSNTYLLEQAYGWTGLLVDPNPAFHDAIRVQRRATLDRRAVYPISGKSLPFLIDANEGELSTLAEFRSADHHRRAGQIVEVETVTCSQLFEDHALPAEIDFLSLDTEGSEIDILASCDFALHRPTVICVEHANVRDRQKKLRECLAAEGYELMFPHISGWDYWFVDETHAQALIA